MLTLPAKYQKESAKIGNKPITFVDFKSANIFLATRFIDRLSDTSDPANWGNGNFDYTDDLLSISSIDINIDRRGGFSNVGNINISINNLDRYSDFLNIEDSIEGQEIVIKQIYDDGNLLTSTDAVTIFTGQIDDYDVNDNVLNISVSYRGLLTEAKVGTIITKDNFPNSDDSSSGKIIPIAYGDHPLEYGDDPSTSSFANVTESQVNNITPGYFIGYNSSGKPEFLIANHSLKTTNTNTYRFWISGPNGRPIQIDNNDVSVSVVSGNSVLTLDVPYILADFWYAINAVDDGTGTVAWLGTVNSFDDNYGSFAFADHSALPATRQDSIMLIDFPEYDQSIEDFDIVDIKAIGTVDDNLNVIPTTFYNYSFGGIIESNTDGVSTGGTSNFSSAGATFQTNGVQAGDTLLIESAVDIGYYTVASITSETALTITGTFGGGAGLTYRIFDAGDIKGLSSTVRNTLRTSNRPTTSTMSAQARIEAVSSASAVPLLYRFFQSYKRIRYRSQTIPTVYVASEAKPYGSWITTRTNHADFAAGAGSLIENPIGVIEDILRDFLSLTTSEIDTAAFDTASNQRTTWKFSFAITEQQDAITLLNELGFASGCYIFYDSQNRISIKAILTAASEKFSNSGTNKPDPPDVVTDIPLETFEITAGNNKFDFKDAGGNSLTATITLGKYNGAGLASELQTQVTAVSIIGSYSFLHSSSTGLFTLNLTGGGPSWEILFSSGASSAVSAYAVFGFDFVDYTGLATYVSVKPLYDDSYAEKWAEEKSFQSEKSDSNEFANSININFLQNYIINSFDEKSTVTDATSITDYGQIDKDINNKFMAVIAGFSTHIIDILKRRYYEFSITPRFSMLGYAFGDIINMRSEQYLEGIYNSGMDTQKHQIIRLRYLPLSSIGLIDFQVIERL